MCALCFKGPLTRRMPLLLFCAKYGRGAHCALGRPDRRIALGPRTCQLSFAPPATGSARSYFAVSADVVNECCGTHRVLTKTVMGTVWAPFAANDLCRICRKKRKRGPKFPASNPKISLRLGVSAPSNSRNNARNFVYIEHSPAIHAPWTHGFLHRNTRTKVF